MSASSSSKTSQPSAEKRYKLSPHWWLVLLLPAWVLVGFGSAQVILTGVLMLMQRLGVSFKAVNESVLNTVVAACVYLLTLAIVIGLPWWLKKYRVSRQEIGLIRLPSWMDIGLAPAGFVVYLLVSFLLVYIVGLFIPGIDLNQTQENGFGNVSHQYEYILAFVTLVVIAPVAEEVLFRGYLYGKLRKIMPIWVAVFAVSLLFGAVHGQWNVAIDVFALSIILCTLREVTGNIWAGILLHMFKNGLAFYILFLNPDLLRIMGG